MTVRLALAVLLAAAWCGCGHVPTIYKYEGPYSAAGSGGIVVTEEAHATRVAVEVLRAGGNAVDATVAAAFALAVTYPEAGNIGGGGFAVVYNAGELWALDFRETAPAAAHRDMYVDLAAQGVESPSQIGPIASGIPGTVAGLHAAWVKGGSLPWSDLVAPALELARSGFTVGERLAESLADKASDLRRFSAAHEVFLPDDKPPTAGERLVQGDLAASLSLIARDGPRAFYEGELAEKMLAGVKNAGGIWSRDDLVNYAPVFRSPHVIAFPGAEHVKIVAMPPPSSGALVLGQTLAFLQAGGTLDMKPSEPARARALVEALRLAFAERNSVLADPLRMTKPLSELLDPVYLARRVALLPDEGPGSSSALYGGASPTNADNTTHIVVMDDRGGVVSLTTTVNSIFGSKYVPPGTGILLNNEMDDFDTQPGRPNMYGLVGTGLNAVAPGARMLSSMSPTIVLKDGEPWLALGARGGPRILTSVLQVIFHRVVDGMNLEQSVFAPRIHHQWWPDEVMFEVPEQKALRTAMEAMGYTTSDKTIGRVIAAERLRDGRFLGVRDPRIGGLALPVRADSAQNHDAD